MNMGTGNNVAMEVTLRQVLLKHNSILKDVDVLEMRASDGSNV